MHDLSRLGERPFEDLCRALAVHALGPGIQAFGDGPDGGREATFEGPLAFQGASGLWNGYGVLQAKCAARLLWQNTRLAIDAAGRRRLRSALTTDPVVNLVNGLAGRLGITDRLDGWERTPPDEGLNDQRFASYRCRIAGESGRIALGLWVRFQLPDGLQPTIVALIDLRIDFTALPALAPRPEGSAVAGLDVDDLRRFFAAAWTTVNDHLSLAAIADPREQEPAGPATTELHLEAEHAFGPPDDRPRTLTDMIDLTAFGEPTRDSLPRMSVAVRAPQMTPGQIEGVVSDTLRHMAAGFGFLEPEDEI